MPVGQLAHQMGGWLHFAPPGQVVLVHLWSVVKWSTAHTPHFGSALHSSWWCPKARHLKHCKFRQSGLASPHRHLRLKRVMVVAPMFLTLPGSDTTIGPCPVWLRTSGRVSHLGNCARINPVEFWISWARMVHVPSVLVFPIATGTPWITHFVHLLLVKMLLGWILRESRAC